ncbi:histidine phosphatase family protein [Chloroflexota bacterium]
MITTLLVIRHGQTDSNISGYYMGWSQEDLNETGYKQVQMLSHRLSDTLIDAIYTSPLKRARATAEAVAELHNITPIVMEELIEINLGDWQELHASDIIKRWPDMWKQSRVDPSGLAWPNGGSFAQTADRSVRAFDSIVDANRGKLVAIVTHDIIARIMAMHVLGVPYSTYRRMEIGNASFTKIVIMNDKNQLITLNATSHLGY